MRKKNKYIYFFIILIILFIIFQFKYVLKDSFNMFLETIFLRKDEKLIITDDLTNTYIKELESDIKEYKEISNLNDCINSTIIYRNPEFWYDELTINKGRVDNIKVGSMVINNEGVIGTISNVYDNTSTISLITNIDKNRKITVGITNKDETIYGLISNYDKNKNEIIISELTKDITITDDLSVITTNFTNTFKEGLIIAKVKYIKDDSNGLSKNVIATPVVDYNDIKYVCVIK